jgi:hypothetical protein
LLGQRVEPLVAEVAMEGGFGHEFPEIDAEPEPRDELGGGVTDEDEEGDWEEGPASGFAVKGTLEGVVSGEGGGVVAKEEIGGLGGEVSDEGAEPSGGEGSG